MNPTICDLFAKIKELSPQQKLVEFHQNFQDDDELEKKIKQTKITKSQFESTEDKSTLINYLINIINDTKTAHKESLLSAKHFEIASSEKQIALDENSNLRKQITNEEIYRNALNIQLGCSQEMYNIVIEKEQEKKVNFFEEISQEFQEIQTKMGETLNTKKKNQIENVDLQEKLNNTKTYVKQRIQYFDQETMKLESQRKERLIKIFEKIHNINQTLGQEENNDGQLEKLQEELALVDKYFNPYHQKNQEYQQIIEKSNQLCNLYKSETEKLIQQCSDYEKKSQASLGIYLKSDIFIVEQAKEYQGLLQKYKQKQEQIVQLQNLKSSIKSKLL